MRLTEFTHKFNTQRLDEVNMSPSNLKSLASNINARAGMEFELCVPETITNNIIKQSFAEAIGKPVRDSPEYHHSNIKRPNHKNNFYLIEPDLSIEPYDDLSRGLEFVSPAMPVAEMISDLDKVVKWATTNGCYTSESTGLHINISVDGWNSDRGRLDYVKLVLLSGDQQVLADFDRQGNAYCQNALEKITRVSNIYFPKLFREMKSGLNNLAQGIIELGRIPKHVSIHPKFGYVEFRAPGGDWLGIYQSNPEKIINTMLRYVVALDAAVDPEKYRNEYLKKLYAMVKPKSNHDPISYFAQYAAGKINFDQLARNMSAIRSRRNNKLVGDISNLTGMISPNLTGKVSPDLKGDVSKITGDVSNIRGDTTKIEGDVSNISGSVHNILGNVRNIFGNVTYIQGNVTYITGDVSPLSGDVSDINGFVGYIEGDVSRIKGNVSNIEGDITNISGDVSNIEGHVGEISGSVSKLKGDVSHLWGIVTNISGNVTNIEGNVTWLRGNVSELDGDVSQLSGDVTGCKGDATGCKGDATGLVGDIREALKVS